MVLILGQEPRIIKFWIAVKAKLRMLVVRKSSMLGCLFQRIQQKSFCLPSCLTIEVILQARPSLLFFVKIWIISQRVLRMILVKVKVKVIVSWNLVIGKLYLYNRIGAVLKYLRVLFALRVQSSFCYLDISKTIFLGVAWWTYCKYSLQSLQNVVMAVTKVIVTDFVSEISDKLSEKYNLKKLI